MKTILLFAIGLFWTIVAQAATLQGIVLDYKGDAVSGATVWVSQDRRVSVTTTDSEGAFALTNLARGTLEVVAMREGHSLGGKEGQLLGDDFVTLRLDKANDLSLRIISGKYEPIEGARLKRLFINESFSVNAEDLVPHGFPSVRSNAEGVMTIPHMPRFGYTSVAVSHVAYAESSLPTFPIGTEVDLIMNPGIKLRGRISDETGKGVARARVALSKIGQGQTIRFSEVLSDPDGFYTINVPPAEYFVVARHRDYAIAEPVMRTMWAGGDEVIADITLPEGHVIEGRTVMKGSGEAVPMSGVKYFDENGVVFAEAMSDREGRFEMTVAAGSGHLEITPPDRLMTVAHNTVPIEIESQKRISVKNIELAPLPAVFGQVFDNQQKRVPMAQVRSLNSDPPIITTTNEQGEYYIQIERMTDEGTLQLYVEHPHRFQRSAVEIDLQSSAQHDIRLQSFRPKLQFMPELARNNLSTMLEEPAPEWTCEEWFNLPEDLESLSLSDLSGKIVVLTFWAGFDMTGQSRMHFEELKYLHGLFGSNSDIQFVAIHDASLKPYEIELVARKWEIPFPVGCDEEAFTSFKAYHVNQIPQTVIIDSDGKLKYYEVEGRLHTLIKAMLRSR